MQRLHLKCEICLDAGGRTAHPSTLFTSSVQTRKLSRVFGPNVVAMATSAASRPRAMSTRPIRGTLFRGLNVYQAPPR